MWGKGRRRDDGGDGSDGGEVPAWIILTAVIGGEIREESSRCGLDDSAVTVT